MSLLNKGMKRRDFFKVSAGAAAAAAAAAGISGCSGSESQEAEGQAHDVVAHDAEVIDGAGEWRPIHCCHNCNQMCLNMGYVVDGVVVRQKTDDSHEDSWDQPQQRGCLRGRSLRQQIYNADRIKYPMKRKNWQPGGGENAHGELRGKDEWERISWDEALTYVTDELKRVYKEYGDTAVICNGWRWAPGSAMFPAIGNAVYNTETESFGTWAFQTEALGLFSNGDHPDIMMAPDKYDLPNADNIILYGCNPAWCHHSAMYYLKNAKDNGVNFIYVGPTYNESASMLEAKWIRVRPGTDTAFLLAVAYEMIRLDEENGGIIDWDFINEKTVGLTAETMPEDADTDENFRSYLLGEYDGQPKTPEWASEICGTPVEDITWYAEMAGKDNADIFLHSYAASRYLGAENLPQAFMTVGALGGHYGKSGHGCAAIYTWDAADSGYRMIQHAGGDWNYFDALVGSPGATGPNRNIEGPSWWSALKAGEYLSTSEGPYDLGSSPEDDPTKLRANTPTYHKAKKMPVNPRLLFQTQSNFMQTRGDLPTAIEVMRGADTVISTEIKYSLTAQFADIILPVITHWEGNDDEEWGELAWPSPFGDGNGQKQRKDALLAWKPLIKPMYEARDEKMVFREIMERMGFDPDTVYPASNHHQWLGYFLGMRVLSEDAKTWSPVLTWTAEDNQKYGDEFPEQEGQMTFDEFMEKGCFVVKRSQDDARNYVGYRDDKLGIGEDGVTAVVTDTAWPRPSLSGKLEIYCQFKADNVNKIGLNDEPIKPYANYFEPRRGYQETFVDGKIGGDKAKYPLQAFTPHYLRRAHTCYDNMPWTQEAFKNPVFMNADDAAERGIKAGDTVVCYNDFGRMLRKAQPMKSYLPGVVGIPHGVRSVLDESGDQIIDRGGSEQMLSDGMKSNYFPQVDGYNSLLIEIEKYDGEELVEDVERGPFLAAGIDDAETPAYYCDPAVMYAE